MLNVLMTSHAADGHVAPLLPVAAHLIKAGHRVRFLTGEKYGDAVTRTGAQFLPWPPEAVSLHEAERATESGIRALSENVERIFIKPAGAQYRAILDALATEPSDVVLTEFTVVGVAGLAWGTAPHPPVVACGILPLAVSSKDTAPWGLGLLPQPGLLGRARNKFLYAMSRHVILRAPQKSAEHVIKEMAGGELNVFFLDWTVKADLYAVFTVPGFEYYRPDLPENVKFVGPLFGGSTRAADLPPWWDDLKGKTVIHVSQGTIATDPTELILPTLKALAHEEVMVVVSTGGADVAALGELPANARAADFIPYAQLMPLVDVYVTNGGYGGLNFALAHGVPMVVAGKTEDKAESTRRVEYSGVGINLDTQTPTEQQIRDAVRQVLVNPQYRQRAQELQKEVQEAPGLDGFTRMIEDVVAKRKVNSN